MRVTLPSTSTRLLIHMLFNLRPETIVAHFASQADAPTERPGTAALPAARAPAPHKAPAARTPKLLTDAEMLERVTGQPGETRASWQDVVRLVHNLRQGKTKALVISDYLNIHGAAHDRLHPGPFLANPFFLADLSLDCSKDLRAKRAK